MRPTPEDLGDLQIGTPIWDGFETWTIKDATYNPHGHIIFTLEDAEGNTQEANQHLITNDHDGRIILADW